MSRLVYADTSGCCVVIATQQLDVWYRHIPAYTKCTAYKVAPDDGLIQSKHVDHLMENKV